MMRQASLNSVTRCPSLIAVKIGSGKMSIIVWVVWVLHGLASFLKGLRTFCVDNAAVISYLI